MLTLASTSRTRMQLLQNAGIMFDAVPPRLDEEAAKTALLAEGATPRDLADALAEMKARKVRKPGLILGCDQVLESIGQLVSKPQDRADAIRILSALSGKRHELHSAAVLYEDGAPVWRHVQSVKMTMRKTSDAAIAQYVEENWKDIRYSAGAYTLEGQGARLFHRVDGDFFAVLGLPLLPLIDILITRGELAG
ncbi:MAG: nucleoside triphosphate pyrophosphatase [Pseudomonadota bacterium]